MLALAGHRFYESSVRSLVKAVTFRAFVLTSDSIVIYGITRQVGTTWKLVLASNLASTLIYYAHERLWNQAHWGKGQGAAMATGALPSGSVH